MRFSRKITLSSSLILVVVMSTSSYFQYKNVQKSIESQVANSVPNTIKGISGELSVLLGEKINFARYIAKKIADSPTASTIIKETSEQSLDESFALVGGAFEDDGEILSGSPKWQSNEGTDGRLRPWYRLAKMERKLVITDPYKDVSTNEMLLSISIPIIKNNEFLGALFFDVSLKKMSELISDINILGSGHAVLFSSQNTIIADNDIGNIGKPLEQVYSGMSNEYYQSLDKSIVYVTEVPEYGYFVAGMVDKSKAFEAADFLRNSAMIGLSVGVLFCALFLSLLIRRLLSPIRDLNNSLLEIANGKGDLTKRLDEKTDFEFSVLAKNFNTFIAHLQKQILLLKDMNNNLYLGANSTSELALSSRTDIESQGQELEQLATAMNEMASTASSVATSAQEAAVSTGEASTAVESGSGVVNSMVNVISNLFNSMNTTSTKVLSLEKTTHEINTVINVINEIAEQTNLLALNAAIEAARAGSQGRGFAVVADEVRKLAQRTQESTGEIDEIIKSLQNDTHEVVSAMIESKGLTSQAHDQSKETSLTLMSIQESIVKIADMTVQIASAAEEQSAVSEEINVNTTKIRDLSLSLSRNTNSVSSNIVDQERSIKAQSDSLSNFVVD